MGALSGLDSHTVTGNVSVAVIAGVGASLAIKDLTTDAAASELQVLLTIDGDLSKRSLDLGTLSASSGTFQLSLPDSANISVYNTVVLRSADTAIGSGTIP
ncbi:hypothetical protein [Synechococcus sp. PCC 7336]|uniref:hypothetical protein n=1 Tax=Synechococcus sp. PCC 7336 TaxID=195250 RepID=UPI0012EA5468|nr:hypothetical protein [Synechococcus sp. PCC 7336]